MDFTLFQDFVNSLLPQIRSIVLKYYDHVDVEYKADESPVTIADKEIERYITDQIAKKFPTHHIIGEEGANHTGTEDWHWVIDPIDGTKSFIHHIPLFTTLIGVVHNGKATFGAIYNPILQELTVGDNHSAFHNGKPCRIRTCDSLKEATLLSSDLFGFHKFRDGKKFEKLVLACRVERSWGDGNGYQMIATGRADIMVDAKMSRWDIIGVLPVVRGAGAVAQGIYGEKAEDGDSLLVTNPTLINLIEL